jgi:predicted dehydrogenase
MRFLIAGYGSVGRRHLRNLLALGEHDIVLYRTRKSTLPEDDLLGFKVETDLSAALEHKPNAVIVANPTALHLDVAIPAARAGCHLFLEKPVSHSLERLEELRESLKFGGGKAFVGFQFRFHPGLQQVKNLLQQGVIGRPLSLRCEWGEYLPGWHPWEDYRKSYSARGDLGGGVVLTLCHPLDYLRWFFGEGSLLQAFVSKISDLEIEVEDVAEVLLQFSDHLLASVHLDYYRRPAVHRLEITGSEGLLAWDNADGAVRLYRADMNAPEVFLPPQGFERNTMFLDEMRHFLNVASGREEPICTLEDGIRALELALQILGRLPACS